MTAYMEWEAQFLLWMQERLRKDRLTKWVRRITQLGNGGLIWLSIACLLFAVRPQRLLAATVITAQLLGVLITNLFIKNTVKRKRPYEIIVGLEALLPPQKDWSFPSGHTTSSVSAGLLLFFHLPLLFGIPCLSIALCIVWSRMYLAVHFPTRYFGRCLHWRILCDDGRVHYTDAVGSRLRELRELMRIIKNICEKCYISLQAGFRLEFCLLFLWQCAIIRTESKWYFGVSYRDSRNQMERWAYTC